MKYRKFSKKIDWEISALGMGCMRLPKRKKNFFMKEIDEEEAIKIIRHAIDNGVNLVDTAYGYHLGKSEIVLGKALKDGYREKVKLQTKLPMWKVRGPDDFDKMLHKQLIKLDVNHIDFYIFHALNRKRFENKVIKFNLLEKMEKARDDGLIDYIGFSFHDNFATFRKIIDSYEWDSCLVQYNYLGEYLQATGEGVKYAHDNGLGVMVMGPVGGGRLAKPNDNMLAVMDGAKNRRTPADWALQYVWNRPEVSMALSGMSSFEQVKENLASAEDSDSGKLTDDDKKILSDIAEQFRKTIISPCTTCNYCLEEGEEGCPTGVNIPKNFSIVNSFVMNKSSKNQKKQKKEYAKLVKKGSSAENCIECMKCVPKCPQEINIPEDLKKVVKLLSQ